MPIIKMPIDEELQMNGVGRTQTVYQQASTGEKHVLFYPTSPAPSANSDERRSWSQASSSLANTQIKSNHRNNGTENSLRMRRNESSTERADTEDSQQDNSKYNFKIGIYGWRKRCLYALILVLLIMVIVNLALTLWVLKVMEFSSEGMGQLKIVAGGLRLDGKAFVLDSLIASNIKSRTGQPIVFESSKNMTLSTRHRNGLLSNRILLGNDRFECLSNDFKVLDDRGGVLFAANKHEVLVGSNLLKVNGRNGGTTFKGSIRTNLVRAESGNELRLESPTRTLEMHASRGIHIESSSGSMRMVALNDIVVKSEDGSIRFESNSIVMPSLPKSDGKSDVRTQIYQLCICNNGKLFVASPHSHCALEDERICR